jgi:hypothetical protein
MEIGYELEYLQVAKQKSPIFPYEIKYVIYIPFLKKIQNNVMLDKIY